MMRSLLICARLPLVSAIPCSFLIGRPRRGTTAAAEAMHDAATVPETDSNGKRGSAEPIERYTLSNQRALSITTKETEHFYAQRARLKNAKKDAKEAKGRQKEQDKIRAAQEKKYLKTKQDKEKAERTAEREQKKKQAYKSSLATKAGIRKGSHGKGHFSDQCDLCCEWWDWKAETHDWTTCEYCESKSVCGKPACQSHMSLHESFKEKMRQRSLLQ